MTVTETPALDLACVEATASVSNAPVECLPLLAMGIGHHDILQGFDLLRRRLSLRLRGTAGSFAGYSRLELTPVTDAAGSRITCVAVLVSATAERQNIRFEAFLEPDDSTFGQPSSRSVRVAVGDGQVVAFR